MTSFLHQARDICGAASLSAANKAKLAKIKTAVEELAAGFQHDAAAAAAAKQQAPTASTPKGSPTVDEASKSMPQNVSGENLGDSSAEGPTTAATVATESLTASLETTGSGAVGSSTTSAPTKHRDIVFIARLVADELCASGIPESARLRKVARDVCQLLLVRCLSITTYRLQWGTTIASSSSSSTSSSSAAAPLVLSSSSLAAAPTTPANASIVLTSFEGLSGAGAATTTSLATDSSIPSAAVAIEAARVCMDCLAQSAQPSQADDVTVRFVMKAFVDVAKQLAKLLYGLQLRLVKQQFQQQPASGTSPVNQAREASNDALEDHQEPSSAKRRDSMAEGSPSEYRFEIDEEEAMAIAANKIQQLSLALGHDPSRVIAQTAELLHHPIAYLVCVAGTSSSSSSAAQAVTRTRDDARNLLFQLFDFFGKLSLKNFFTTAPHQQQGPLATPLGQQLALHFADQISCPVIVEAVAALAKHCGDENDGQLLAVKLLTDSITLLAGEDPSALRSLLKRAFHKKAVLNAILVAVVSVHTSVIAAGLAALEAIVSESLLVGGQELGFLYSNCLLRLLESEHAPNECKLLVIGHYMRVIATPPQRSKNNHLPPILLQLYAVFDLNERLHQCNMVQQFAAAFARIVRTAQPHDFIPQKHADPSSASGSRRQHDSGPTAGDGTVVGPSLSFAALNALVLTAEVLTASGLPSALPPSASRDLPPLTLRDAKLSAQRQIDVINNNPVKGIIRKFGLEQLLSSSSHGGAGATEVAEASPLTPQALAQALEYTNIPPPSEEVSKIIPSVSNFLLYTPSLNPMSVGEFLTDPKPFPLQVCKHFMSLLDLRGRTVPAALSEMLTVLQLPKEGQRIERLLEFFSHSYFIANIDKATGKPIDEAVFPFRNVDACFVVVVATVMLNTDLHNPRVSSKMNRTGFASQLRGCNDNQNFPDGFADAIFDSISRRPLSNVKGIGAANVDSQAHVSTVLPPSGKMDLIFFSNEERKELLYGMERQRIVSETRELIVRRSPEVERLGPEWKANGDGSLSSSATVLATARDLFLAVWPSLCVIFGVAMGGSRVADVAQVKCVKGLHCSFCLAAAFSLQTEADVTLMTLLQMSSHHETAVRAALAVAASEYGENLSQTTWSTILQLLSDAKKGHLGGAAAEVESVYSSVETIVAHSMSTPQELSSSSSLHSAAERPASMIIEAMMKNVANTARGDGLSLATQLHILRRALIVTQIEAARPPRGSSHHHSTKGTTTTVVTKKFAVGLYVRHVLPHLPNLFHHNSGSEECLQLLTESVTIMLTELWKAQAAGQTPTGDDVVYALVVEACSTYAKCYESPPTTLSTKVHLMQGVRALLSSTITSMCTLDAAQLVSFDLLQAVWKQLLGVIARALCDPGVVGTEGCSLAVLILRNVCVLCTASGATAATTPIPPGPRNLLFLLLIRACYIGGMCSDVTNAKTCVHQLAAIGTTALNYAAPSASSNHSLRPVPSKSLLVDDPSTGQHDQSPQRSWSSDSFAAALDENIILDVLETLCLLLRCEKDVIRSDAVEALRQVALQLMQSHLPHLAVHISNVVLEGVLGHATAHFHVPVTDPSVSCFPLFGIHAVPQSMKRCSRTSFTATLPAAVQFVTHELLTACANETLRDVAEIVVLRMLLPVLVSPRSHHTPSRSIAARAMMAVVVHCASRESAGGPPLAGLSLDVVLRAIGLALFATRTPPHQAVLSDEPLPFYVKPRSCFSFDRYAHECEASLLALARCEAPDVSRRDGVAVPHPSVEVNISAPSSTTVGQQAPAAAVDSANAILQPLVVAPLPKILEHLVRIAPEVLLVGPRQGEADSDAADDEEGSEGFWTPPKIEVHTLMLLLKQCASDATAAYRGTLRHEAKPPSATPLLGIGVSPAKAATLHKEQHSAQSPNGTSVAHASIRGALDSYFILAMGMATTQHSLPFATDAADSLREDSLALFQLFRTVQQQLHQVVKEQHQPGSGASTRWPVIHSCLSGMAQETATVVQHWVHALASLSTSSRVLWERFGRMPEMFQSIVDLLDVTTPLAGASSAQEYFLLTASTAGGTSGPDVPVSPGIARAVHIYLRLFLQLELSQVQSSAPPAPGDELDAPTSANVVNYNSTSNTSALATDDLIEVEGADS